MKPPIDQHSKNSKEQIRAWKVAYATAVPEYCRQIKLLWLEAGTSGATQKSRDQLVLNCHKLSGSAASYGLDDIARLAGMIEAVAKRLRDGEKSLGLAKKMETERLLKKLLELASQVTLESLHDSVADSLGDIQAGNIEPLIYIVDDDLDQVSRLALQLASHGFQTKTFQQLDDLREAILTCSPAAIVADIVFPEGASAGIEAMAALRHTGRKSLPVVFISRRTDAEARLLALRAGGSGYFTKPISLPSLAAKLHELTDQAEQRPFRILIVDDDASTTMLHSAILKKAGCKVCSVTDPLNTIQEAFDFRPELIFMDLYMPGANGLEVAMMLRQEESFLDVPIVFLSGEEDEKIKTSAIKDGAATFLNKPVLANNLIEVAKSRAHQYRARAVKTRYLGRIEPVTGLFTRDYLVSELSQYCGNSKESTGLVALLMLELDDYGYLFRTIGEDRIRLLRAHVAHLLRSCLEEQDIAASYTDSSFLVLTSQQNIQSLERFANKIHRAITVQPVAIMGHALRISASIGISRVSGNDQNQILSQASLACSLAQNETDNWLQFHSDLHQEALEDRQILHLKQQIKGAIDNRRILLAYSPVVGISVESVERYTALMRLVDDKGKTLYPSQFMVVAIKYDLMPGLDRWAVVAALRALSKKQAIKPETQFFVKLSRPTILDREFARWLKRALKTHSIIPDSCIFEIKEDDLLVDLDQVRDLIGKLRQMNCNFTLEHFGRSMDSFKVLKLLRPGYLRLDPGLLHDLSRDNKRQEHIRKICDRAHDSGSKVLAAYIQDSQTLAVLWNIGVDYIQGDFLEQPTDLRDE